MQSATSLPEGFILPALGAPHCHRVNHGILGEQGLDVCRERVRGIDGVQPVSDITEMRIKFVRRKLPGVYPLVWKTLGKIGFYNNMCIPKASVVSTDVADDSNTSQPILHILIFGNVKTATHCFLSRVVFHVAVKFGQRSHRCYFHCLPYGRHGGRA